MLHHPYWVLAMLLILLMCMQLAGAATNDPNAALLQQQQQEEKWSHFAPYQQEKRAEILFQDDKESLAYKVFSAFEHRIHPILERFHAKLDASQINVTHLMLPMRDGVRLSTFVIKRKHKGEMNKKRSTMLSRSPYGPTSDQIANIFLAVNDFVAVVQDQRGTFASEGEYSMWHHDASDGFDTLQWIEAQEWSNGRVFSCGVSADGIGTAAMILSQPKQLKGQVLMWATMDGYSTAFPGGVFREGLIAGWMALMAPLTRGVSLRKVLPDILAHQTMDEWWAPIKGPGNFHQVEWPTIHISGWWDIFQGHQIDMFNEITQKSLAHDHYLIVGPMGHCIIGMPGNLFMTMQENRAIANGFGLATEIFADEQGLSAAHNTPFKNKMKKINIFVQRGGGKAERAKMFWSSFDKWPAIKPSFLVLGSNNEASIAHSLEAASNPHLRKAQFYEFAFGPLLPVITNGGNNLILMMLGRGCGSMNQRQNAESRRDALVFTTPEIEEEDLALTGKIRAVIYLSTNGKDADVYVSLNDVYLDEETGEEVSMQIRYGMQRLRARDSTPEVSKTSPVHKDEVYKVVVDMWSTSYVVPKGHRLRVVISSSSAPYYAVNLDGGRMVQFNRVHWSAQYPSHVELPVVDLKDLPVNGRF